MRRDSVADPVDASGSESERTVGRRRCLQAATAVLVGTAGGVSAAAADSTSTAAAVSQQQSSIGYGEQGYGEAGYGGVTDTATVAVTIDATNSPVTAGETLTVTAAVENTGSGSVTQTVTLSVGGQQRDATSLTVAAGATETVTLSWATGSGDAGTYTATVATGGASASVAVSVTQSEGIVAQYDADDSGTINNSELLAALADYPEQVSPQDLLTLLAVYDPDG